MDTQEKIELLMEVQNSLEALRNVNQVVVSLDGDGKFEFRRGPQHLIASSVADLGELGSFVLIHADYNFSEDVQLVQNICDDLGCPYFKQF